MLAVLQTSSQEIEAGTKQALKVGSAVAQQLVQTRNEQISRSVKLLASDYALKEAIAILDPESARSALNNHSNRIGAQVSTFVYLDAVEQSDQSSPELEQQVKKHVVDLLDTDEPLADIFSVVFDDSVYQIYTAEMRAPTTIGYLVLGFKVDQSVVEPIRKLTDLNVAVLHNGPAGINTVTSKLDAVYSQIDTSRLIGKGKQSNTVYPVLLGQDEFWVTHLPLTRADERVLIVLASEKLKPHEHFLNARDNVLMFGLGLLVLVVAFGAWLSASVSRPLRTLAVATHSLAKGEYESRILVHSQDEIGDLASDFEEMRKAIAKRESQISHQLMHDQLTGLPNQKHTIDKLESWIADNSVDSIALIVVKIQSMEQISSSLGLHAAEELTRDISRSIVTVAGDAHFVSCIDSNRFAVACRNTDDNKAQTTALSIMEHLDLGSTRGSTKLTVKSYAGIALYPTHTSSAEQLIRYAMIASADAREKKKRANTYDIGREAEFSRYQKIVQDLPCAVEKDDLKVYYQPKVSLETGELYGAEALVRWEHPELGFLPPDDFISAAENSDNIKMLTRYVIKKAIHAACRWQTAGYNLKVAINLSARDLLDPDLFAFVIAELEENQFPPTHLILEITESSVMEEIDLAVKTLTTFRETGIQISIDDFGTGHSSLAQLRNIPLDELKIDKSFVSQLSTDSTSELLISTTIKLAHGMGLKVVAEGIEDEYSLRRLTHYNCEIAQGYFFSRPLPEEDFFQWVIDFEPIQYFERRSDMRPFTQNPTNISEPINTRREAK